MQRPQYYLQTYSFWEQMMNVAGAGLKAPRRHVPPQAKSLLSADSFGIIKYVSESGVSALVCDSEL
jgi:hypothetical protein